MAENMTLLVLLLAVAAGLVTATVSALLVQSRRTAFFRYFLANILLFNLLVLQGLVLEYGRRHLPEGGTVSPATLFVVLLILMAALKLGWLYAFSAMNRVLPGRELSARFNKGYLATAGVLFVFYGALLSVGIASEASLLVAFPTFLLESLVIGGAVAASTRLLATAARFPAGPRRQSLIVFGSFHLVLLVAVLGTLVSGWVWTTEHNLFNGLFLILYNLFPLGWILRFQPVGPGSLVQNADRYGITAREREIIELVAAGRTNQEIADQLFISLATVKDHNYNIFRKTGVRNRLELANLFRVTGP